MSTLARLQQHTDVSSLRSALLQLCSEFGRITRLDVMAATHQGVRRAICFLRMDRPEQEQQLMQTLGVGRYGGEVVFVIRLSGPEAEDDEAGTPAWADSNIYGT
jgi:hypothetical protein